MFWSRSKNSRALVVLSEWRATLTSGALQQQQPFYLYLYICSLICEYQHQHHTNSDDTLNCHSHPGREKQTFFSS